MISKIDAMEQYMAYLVLHEGRTFCSNDFLSFEWEGEKYKADYGYIRNVFSRFKKEGKIEFCYYDINAYYSLKGYPLSKKSMTPNHRVSNLAISPNHPLYKMLKNQIFDKNAIHNIRLKTEVPNIYQYSYSTLQWFDQDPVNRDFRVAYQNIDNRQMQIRVHKSDTVTIIIGCSLNPTPLDNEGFISLYKILGIAQGYLQGLTFDKNVVHIPDCDDWIITMWHFNRDGLKEYTGELFSISVEGANHTVHTIYAKEFAKNKYHVRDEFQWYPNMTVKEVKNKTTTSFTFPSIQGSDPSQLPNIVTNSKDEILE